MHDKIERTKNGSLIQHGNVNKRVYLMKLDQRDSSDIINTITTLARKNKYTKIFCKIPGWAAPVFFANGFILEAQIPRCYQNKEAAFFVSKFLNSDRVLEIESDRLREFSHHLTSFRENNKPEKLNGAPYSIRVLNEEDCRAITKVYQQVFETYPFPIFDPEFIMESMNEGVQYLGMKTNNKLIALASAEVDAKGQNAEMTDFATLPEFRGKNLSLFLLKELEKQMKQQGIKTLHTIARLNSPGMNKTFIRMNYFYGGTLIKNTNISGKIESMNVYYKHI